jgi:type 1 glutamine amidotransferase
MISHSMNRRRMLQATGAALLAPWAVRRASAAQEKNILFFTKSSGFEHSVIKRKGDELSHAEKILTEIGKKSGFNVTCSKDGGMFESDKIGQFDAFVFETTGNLLVPGTDKQSPMSEQGLANFLQAIEAGKGFVGFHCATDTFGDHRKMGANDPYIKMIGGHFAGHGAQQVATIGIADPDFPGAKAFGTGKEFQLNDEWYGQKYLADDLRVIYYYKTDSMKGHDYERPNYPQTWARMQGKGRVFYNSMGHREDVWSNPKFQELAIAALTWTTGGVSADVTPNVEKVTPDYKTLPKPAAKKAAR